MLEFLSEKVVEYLCISPQSLQAEMSRHFLDSVTLTLTFRRSLQIQCHIFLKLFHIHYISVYCLNDFELCNIYISSQK